MAVNSTDISKIRDLIENAIKAGADPKLLIPDITKIKQENNKANPSASLPQNQTQQNQSPQQFQPDPLLEDFLETEIAKNIGKKREYCLNKFIASKYEEEFASTQESIELQKEFNESFASFRKEQREDLKREVEELKKQLKELTSSKSNNFKGGRNSNDTNSEKL